MSTACPSFEALFASGRDSEIAAHLATCRRCQTLVRHLRPIEIASEAAALEKEPLAGDRVAEPALGSVYAIDGPLADEYLVGALVEWADDEAVVVPISDEVRYATNWDLLLEQHLLGYRAIAQVWNHGPVLVEQLNEKLGELGERGTALQVLYAAVRESVAPATALPVGPPVLSELDPRRVFQDAESERASLFWQPAQLLGGAASIFEVVRRRREELALAPEALELDAGTLAALEHGRLDFGSELPAELFATLLRRLKLSASRRLERLVVAAVLATHVDPIETRAAMARKRRGMQKRTAGASRERFAAEYARKVMEELD